MAFVISPEHGHGNGGALTNSGGVEGPGAIYVVEAAGDLSLGWPIADQHHVGGALVDVYFLLVLSFLDVNDEDIGALIWDAGDGLANGLDVAAAILSYYDVGFQIRRAGREQPSLAGGDVRRVSLGEELAVDWEIERGQGIVEVVDDGQNVAGQLGGAVEHLPHGLSSVGGGALEAIDARLLVGDGGAEPYLEVVEELIEVGDGEVAEPVNRPSEVIDGIVEKLTAILEGLRGAGVLGSLRQHRGVIDGVVDVFDGDVEGQIEELLGVGVGTRHGRQRVLAGFLVVRRPAEILDILHGG